MTDEPRATVTEPWHDYERSELSAPLAAALAAFEEQGYHGTSVREIAGRAGLSVPGLYHHYPSKQSLLQGLLEMTMNDLTWRTESALAATGDDPVDRYDAVVEVLLQFHIHRRAQAFIGSSEIRSLEPDYRPVYTQKRRKLQGIVDDLIRDGVRAGVFHTGDPKDTGRAITTMCVGVSTWYRPDGRLSAEEIVARFGRIARAAVGYTGDRQTPHPDEGI